MKVRDLLIKRANGEDLPQKIKINKTIYELNNINSLDELYVEKGKHWYYYNFNLTGFYDNEVEILEEEKKIPEKINIKFWSDEEYTPEQRINVCMTYIDEIIDYLHYLKSKGDE